MPHRCDPCDRSFAHKEALQAHLKSSSLEHPFCSLCDRRFNCQSARVMHMANKHPPTFDCESCNRTFRTPSALQSHYRGHASHPNCARCGRGFKDTPERDEHQRPCELCGVVFCEDTLKTHYQQSPEHPNCSHCEQGFRDEPALSQHITAEHPEPQPESESLPPPSQSPSEEQVSRSPESPAQNQPVLSPRLSDVYAITPATPPSNTTSPRLAHGFPTMIPPSLRAHIDVAASMRQNTSSPALVLPKKYAAQIMDEQTPIFSPLSALPHPESVPPGAWQNIPAQTISSSRGIDNFIQVVPRRPIPPPQSSMPSGTSSRRPLPIAPTEAARFNNGGTFPSPPPQFGPFPGPYRNVWAERSAMQAASLSGPGASRPLPMTVGIPVAMRNSMIPTSSTSSLTLGPMTSSAYADVTNRHRGFSLSRASYGSGVPLMGETTDQTTVSMTPPAHPVFASPAWRDGTEVGRRSGSVLGLRSSGPSLNNGSQDVNVLTSRLLAPSVPRVESGSSAGGVNDNPWNVRLPASPPSSHPPVPWKVQLPSSRGGSRSGSGSVSSGVHSPEVFSPFDLPALPPPPLSAVPSPMVPTPISGHPELESGPRQEGIRIKELDTTSALLKESTLTPSRRLPLVKPQSQIVVESSSPLGRQNNLPPLHMASQIRTPGGIQNQQPLGHMRVISSPRTSTRSTSASVLDSLESVPTSFDPMDEPWDQLNQEVMMMAGSPGPVQQPEGAEAGVIEEDQEQGGESGSVPVSAYASANASPGHGNVAVPTLTSTPPPGSLSGHSTSASLRKPPGPTRTNTLTPPRPPIEVYEPREPQSAISVGVGNKLLGGIGNDSLVSMTPAESYASPRVHCRMCKSDPCIEMTATMCGHIFCYRCITKHVMNHSQCPVCQTPTLLYCLFRLHLYS